MFRSPQLPPDVPGRLFLHSMPGKEEPFADACAAIAANDVVRVVSLTPLDEVAEKSPEYALAIEAGTPWVQVIYPIADFGVPDNEESFKQTVDDIATALRKGENVLVHCAAGIGRTGTFAVAVLCRLGVSLDEARRRVKRAGSSAESEDQRRFLERFCFRSAAAKPPL